MSTLPPTWMQGFEHIWLPYTQMQIAGAPLPVVGTEGVHILLADGRRLIDGISSWWSVCHGYNHPHIMQAVETQLRQFSHVMFQGFAHEPAYRLAERLVAMTPEGLDKVFFSDSGSTAVEVAMKMATQYWHNQGQKNKSKFLCFRHGYHGDTMGCMSLCDPEGGMHKAFGNYMPMQYSVDIPLDEYDFSEFDALLGDIHKTVAAVVIEPLVQGAGGMKFHSPDIAAEIYRLAKKHDILYIADEIMTGFGRTGLMFACDEAAITPDIMCLGKGLTGGTMTLAATLATEAVFEQFLDDSLHKALMSGPTFMGNPLACAAANASLDLFEQEPRLAQIAQIETQLLNQLLPLKHHDKVADIRVKGAIGVVQLHDTSWEQMFAYRDAFIEQGVWVRPFGDVIYLMPPFIIKEEELTQLTRAIIRLLEE